MRKITSFAIILSAFLLTFNLLANTEKVSRGKDKWIADKRATPADLRLKWWDDHLALKESSPFKNIKWRSVGPWVMSGRITDVAVPKGSSHTIYAAVASGGVWKTTNEGTTWEPIFENESCLTIGDIAVADSDPDIIWVGGGENNSSRSSYSGTGVFKSSDSGKSWRNMGLHDSHHIGRIVIHPKDSDIVYVAAIGHLFTRNEERGVFKTIDGGNSWEKILFINDDTGVIDLVMDPSDPDTLYAATWQRSRKAWDFVEDGPGSGIHKTTDGGNTWKKLSNGFPTENFVGRIGLDIAASNPSIIYALLDNQAPRSDRKPDQGRVFIKGAEVYKSLNKGETWTKAHEGYIDDLYSNIGYYFGQIRVDPKDENKVFVLGIPLMLSQDGGKSFKKIGDSGVHTDHHALWIDPKDTAHVIDGNDGGLNFSYDGGKTWKKINNMPLGQFYAVNYDWEKPYNIYGGLQDNGIYYGPHTWLPGVSAPWKLLMGGDGVYVHVDPVDADIVYAQLPFGRVSRVDKKTGSRKIIRPESKEGEPPLRFNWHTPIHISSHNRFILYVGANKVFKSLDRGDHWHAISPDLSTNPEQGNVPFGSLFTISESPVTPGLIYGGTDDGNVWVTKNGGAHWEKINKGLPSNKWVSRVVASRFDKATVYVSLNGYRDDDFDKYLYKSKDFGKTWVSIANNLPCGPINVVREDPQNKNILYVGTDIGVYVSLNGGKSWTTLGGGLPTVEVHDLVIHPRDNDIILGTHGRSVFIMDAEMIQEFGEEIKEKTAHLFDINPVLLPGNIWDPQPELRIYYYLNEGRKINVSVIDREGKIIKELSGEGTSGLNEITWDLIIKREGRRIVEAGPGEYKIMLNVGHHELEKEFRIK